MKNAEEIAETGYILGNCVEGYIYSAEHKNCILLRIMKEDKIVGCIELSNKYDLRQALGKFNQFLQGDVADALVTWIQEKGIKNYEECSSYKNLNTPGTPFGRVRNFNAA